MKPLKDLAVYDDADFYDQEFAARTQQLLFCRSRAANGRTGDPPSVPVMDPNRRQGRQRK
ncbi:hypothetical protein BIV25_21780 [Streptomyces sp. MUSC 14]|uniref:hypothetical protein n=1 Tax=Streptomyces sp. MUSC 14 TaxID=1354889 RepID=UPI0008F5E963|nr:hypothetical protein [Streptomyces sp. MUSC 14]OIJ94711.1 hypothetical protein BIV25_21780 [Streptomyces sp. MUSC 14]